MSQVQSSVSEMTSGRGGGGSVDTVYRVAGADQYATAGAGGVVRKIVCRYGRGCSHINDPSHRERFWHPPVPTLTLEQLRTHYICNECGVAMTSLTDLQVRCVQERAASNPRLTPSPPRHRPTATAPPATQNGVVKQILGRKSNQLPLGFQGVARGVRGAVSQVWQALHRIPGHL